MIRPASSTEGSGRRVLLLTLAVALLVGLFGCSTAAQPGAGTDKRPQPPAATDSSTDGATTRPGTHAGPGGSAEQLRGDPYAHLARLFHERHVQVWFETDLVARWLEGPAPFRTAFDRLAALARVPGTVGFKIADELGYGDGLESPDQVVRFLSDAHRALSRAAPGARLLVDVVVPEIGCLPWVDAAGAACAAQARRDYPAAGIEATEQYLRLGLVDDLDLSTGLLDEGAYAARGLTRRQAQESAWDRVTAWGWSELTGLRARKALAGPHGYAGSQAQAADDVATFVDVPVSHDVMSVDIWTWRQAYEGGTYSLLDEQLGTNPLWDLLLQRQAAGVHLLTHASPSTLPTAPKALAHECDLIADVFDAVFVAAGTG